MVRLEASRTTAKTCGRISCIASSRRSRSSITLRFAFHSAILPRSSSSLSAEISGSSRLISSTSGLSRLTSRSFLEPKIFRATREKAEAILYEQLAGQVSGCVRGEPHRRGLDRDSVSLAGNYLILKSGSRERVYLLSQRSV